MTNVEISTWTSVSASNVYFAFASSINQFSFIMLKNSHFIQDISRNVRAIESSNQNKIGCLKNILIFYN